MGVYNDFILPRLCHLSMRNRRLAPYRNRVIGGAEGRVLEIGVGVSPAQNALGKLCATSHETCRAS